MLTKKNQSITDLSIATFYLNPLNVILNYLLTPAKNKIAQETLSPKDKTLVLNELAKSIVSDSRMCSLFDES